MKTKYIFKAVAALVTAFLLQSCATYERGTFVAWKSCIERSQGSDSDCKTCDIKHNNHGQFKLN